ncbi:hypothetical protein Ahy_A01g001380 [Arachis hypogaea]|uniref:Aminotransferase-like plant mobile domain-containing protein n=1 Tax=Arachis hypogaea TaxID=3818 RepID=A0A445ENB3_ARAHY|nr:hypothetical protein Ahy_A01g001380 [Arachis hypogaea]
MQLVAGSLPDGTDDTTVRRLEDMGEYSWGSATLSWLYRCMYRVANRNVVKLAGPLQLLQSWIFWRSLVSSLLDMIPWSGHNPTASEKGPRVAH